MVLNINGTCLIQSFILFRFLEPVGSSLPMASVEDGLSQAHTFVGSAIDQFELLEQQEVVFANLVLPLNYKLLLLAPAAHGHTSGHFVVYG